jgi:hypothetical protein
MLNAMMKLLSIISQNGALLTPTPLTQMYFMFSSSCVPGTSVIGVSNTALLFRCRRDKRDVQRKQDHHDPHNQHGMAEYCQPTTVLNHW